MVARPLAVAVMVTFVETLTVCVVIRKVAVSPPAGTVTLAGRITFGSELVRNTVTLPGAAGASSVTVPVEVCPPVTVEGLRLMDSGPIGRTMSEVLTDPPLRVAVMFPVAVEVTAWVLTVKVAVVFPANTVTVAGTVAAEKELLRATTVLTGAVLLRVTVPVAVRVPITVEGLMLIEAGAKDCTTRVRLVARPLAVAVMVMFLVELTAWVVTVKLIVVLPAAIVTLAGTVAAGSELVSVTTVLPGAEAASSVTVPVVLCPPSTVLGKSERDCGPMGRTVREVFADTPLSVAVMLPVTVEATAWVLMVKVAVVFPASTVTVAGTVAAEKELLRATTVLTAGAEFMVSVPVAVAPPITVEELILTEAGASGCTVIVLVVARPLAVAVKVMFFVTLTA